MYEIESWVIMNSMMKLLEIFHHLVDQMIAGETDQHIGVEGWEWPNVEEALEAAGICPMKE